MEPGSGYAYNYGPFLPRPTGTFTQGAFGPMSPILPVPVDTPGPGLPRAQPRRWQPYPGYNLPVGQPGNEGYKLASFDTLKTLSETYSILRTCIEIRKNEIRALDWDITLTQDAAKMYQGDKEAMRDFGARRAQAMKFFRRPDPNYYTFESWLHAMCDQVFTLDALSLYMCPVKGRGMRRGLLGSDLDSLWLINGSSIRPLMGLHGEVPAPPAPAFQQYEFGVPRADLTMMLAGLDLNGEEGDLLAQIRGDQLIYHPYLQRPDSPYGFSLVEQALVPIMTGLRRQAYQLDYFSESSTPRVYISPGDATLTPNQIRELQDALNAVAGDIAWAFKIQVLPPGSKVTPVKDIAIVDDSDNWIATEVAMVCNISPVELGLIPKVSSVASPFAAREMAQASRSIHERTSTKPTLSYLTSIMDMILQQVCHQDDMRFVFTGMEETQDQAAVIDMGVKAVQSGLKSIDEVRVNDLHLPPWNLPETSSPVVFTQMGPIGLGQAESDTVSQIRQALTGAQHNPQAQSAVEALQRRASSSGQSPRKALPAGTSGQGRMNGAVTQRQARRGGALAPANAMAEGSPGHSGASSPGSRSANTKPTKAAHAELEALTRHLAKGMPISEWVPEHIPGHVMAMIAEDLEKGLSAGYAVKMAAASLPKPPVTAQAQAQAQRRQQAQQQQQQAATQAQLQAQSQAQLNNAFAAAITASGPLVAAWIAGTLAVTAAVLVGMILTQVRQAIDPALKRLWTDAWQAAERSADSPEDAAALEAFLASWGERWLDLISSTGEQAILDAIRHALETGDPTLIMHALEDLLSSERADQIAASEVTRAWNAAITQSMTNTGVAYRTWRTRNDGKVCARCKANQAQGPVAINRPFASGAMTPPQHPNCRCWLVPSAPPPPNLTGKVLRREVGLNGQEIFTPWEPQPETTGGRVFQPHRGDGIQFVPQGGVPGASAGGAPPRWDGSEPEPVVERAPDADDDAAYGQAAGIGARPGTYWPAQYMDGFWPAPHGQGMAQPPASPMGAETGIPPNPGGKASRKAANAAVKFLRNAPHAKPGTVYHQMLENFPPDALGWVKRIRWVGPVEVPLELIDSSGRDKWAARHDQDHVDDIARKLQAKEHVNPGIGVVRAGHNHVRLIDGRHRFSACEDIGWPLRMYIGYLDNANEKAAYDTYLHQVHEGDDPNNKSFTAGNLGIGSVSGLVPFNLQGAPAKAASCAGLAVRAADTGRVLMLQRAITEDDPAAGLWEIPGGHMDQGEEPFEAAVREFCEETGHGLPDEWSFDGSHWDSSNGIYTGFVVTIPRETDIPLGEGREFDNPDGDAYEAVAWWDPELIDGNPAARPELRADYAHLAAALQGVAKSAQTPIVSTVHHPLGHEGLWHTPDRHVATMQQLPAYVQNAARAIARDGGGDPEDKIPEAIAAVDEWSHGTAFGGKVKVTPEVQEAATRAMAEWEKLKESHHG